MKYRNTSVEGIFIFDELGDVRQFQADRYYGGTANSKKEKWVVDVTGVKKMNGIRIPFKNNVTWQLQDGNFTWAKMEITAIDYDVKEHYK